MILSLSARITAYKSLVSNSLELIRDLCLEAYIPACTISNECSHYMLMCPIFFWIWLTFDLWDGLQQKFHILITSYFIQKKKNTKKLLFSCVSYVPSLGSSAVWSKGNKISPFLCCTLFFYTLLFPSVSVSCLLQTVCNFSILLHTKAFELVTIIVISLHFCSCFLWDDDTSGYGCSRLDTSLGYKIENKTENTAPSHSPGTLFWSSTHNVSNLLCLVSLKWLYIISTRDPGYPNLTANSILK